MILDRLNGWYDLEVGSLLVTAPAPRSRRPEGRSQPGPEPPPPDRSWMAKARCRGSDPGLFYPTPNQSQVVAKAVCAECPVRQECLDYALANNEKFGMWGGLNERERRRLKRQRTAA